MPRVGLCVVVLFIPCLVAGSHAASQLFFIPQPSNPWDSCDRFLIVLVVAWQLTLALCTRAGSTQPTSFTYNGFSKATSIQFNGSATNVTTSEGPVLQLTPASASKAGSAFTSNSVTLAPNA